MCFAQFMARFFGLSFWQDLFATLIGAGFGAWLGFNFALKKDRVKEQKRMDEDKRRRMAYLKKNLDKLNQVVNRMKNEYKANQDSSPNLPWRPGLSIDGSLLNVVHPDTYRDIAGGAVLDLLVDLHTDVMMLASNVDILRFLDAESGGSLINSPIYLARVNLVTDSIFGRLPDRINKTVELLQEAMDDEKDN